MCSSTTHWNKKYWDIHSNLYWTPRFLGLRSISQERWHRQGGMVCISEELVNKDGPLYCRERKEDDLREYLKSQEEILNHLFSITFAIAPDILVRDLFLTPFQFRDSGTFQFLWREIWERYGWTQTENVMQLDSLFVSEQTAVAVELKLASPSSLGQVAKYVALMTWEEKFRGRQLSQIGLLYVIPEDARNKHWQKCGLDDPPRVSGALLEDFSQIKLPKKIQRLFKDHGDQARSILDRMKFAVITWGEIRARLTKAQQALDPGHAGDQTLYKLIAGFLAQLNEHEASLAQSR